MYRKIFSFLEKDTFDENYNEYDFFNQLFKRHKDLIQRYGDVEVVLIKNLEKDIFVFHNGSVSQSEAREFLFHMPNDEETFAKNELNLIFNHDITNSSSYNVNLVLRDELEEFEVFTDKSRIVFRNDKALFLPINNDFVFFSISTDLLVLWFDQFRH